MPRDAACRSTCCSTGWARGPWIQGLLAAARAAGCDRADLPPALLVSPGPAQQPHPPQAAGHRRQARLHRRRGHGHRMEGRAQGPAALARDPLQGRGPGGRADAGGVRRQLDQGHGPRAARRGIFPEARERLRRHGRADVRQLARRRLREHAPHGAAGVDGGEDVDRHRERVLRAGQAHGGGAVFRRAARRARPHRRARPAHRCAHRPLGGAGSVRRAARGRHPDLRIPADDDAL